MSSTSSSSTVCPHCGESLSKKTLLAHKRLYYDNERGIWIKKNKRQPEADGEMIKEIYPLNQIYKCQNRPG